MKFLLIILFLLSVINAKSYRYVCYHQKKTTDDKPIYLGCEILNSSCESNKLLHFGKYPNYKMTKKALERCNSSNPKFINNEKPTPENIRVNKSNIYQNYFKLLKDWNKFHNNKNIDFLYKLYSNELSYYGTKQSRDLCIKDKLTFFKKHPYYKQYFKNQKIIQLSSTKYKIVFDKYVSLNGEYGYKKYPSYLVINNNFEIIKESDTITDTNIQLRKFSNISKKDTSIKQTVVHTLNNAQKLTKPQPVKKESKAKSGTGFFVTNSQIVTNYHVIKGCSDIVVRRNGYKTTAKIRSKDVSNDLSVLDVDDKNDYYLTFRSGDKRVKLGEQVITMGYPLGEYLGTNIKLTTGIISSLNGVKNDSTKYQFTAPTQHGNSGGPLIDNYGDILGVIYAGLSNAQNVNLAIKSSIVKAFLEANGISFENDTQAQKKEISDIVDKSNKAIVQVICR